VSDVSIRSPRETIKLLTPGAVQRVYLLFQTRTGHVSLVKVPKVHVKNMLRQLPENSSVSIEIMSGLREATVAGAIGPIPDGDPFAPAAGKARRLS
jgi:hypothetical protein